MFGKSDPASNLKRVRATLKMRSGRSEIGAILIPTHRALREVLNDETTFVEIETEAGRVAFVLKTDIARIDPHDVVEPRMAGRGVDAWSRFEARDARLVLGVNANATDQQITAAWRDLAKAYHPDRLAALGLPDEILRHADRVMARVNAAYQSLKSEANAQRG
jgi:DnaJ-domain-containing protein 1